MSRALARPLGLLDIFRSIYKEMEGALDVSICFVGLYDSASQSVEVVWQIHDGAELPGGHFPLGSGVTSEVIRSRRPQLMRRWSTRGPRVQVQYATDRAGLPESGITVPMMFDDRVVGVLALQSYKPDAYDEDDLTLVQSVADQAAVAVSAALRTWIAPDEAAWQVSEVEAILATMPDALLVLDAQGCLVRLNQAARQLLCQDGGTVILGYPVDRPQSGQWPLGTQAVTEQLLPLVDRLKGGEVPRDEVRLTLAPDGGHVVSCKASALVKDGSPAGGLLILRDSPTGRAA